MTGLRIPRTDHRFSFAADAEPYARVRPGGRVVVETLDCFSNKITSESQVFERESDLLDLIGAFNPVSAPLYVEGARPGDMLAVHIEDIQVGTVEPYAVTVVTGDRGSVCGRQSHVVGGRARTAVCAIEDGEVRLATGRGTARLPVRPMVGTIGTAPAAGEHISLVFDPGHCGNVDCPQVTVGATVLLPVNVPGGLVSLGDVHALMGDAEVTGMALETHADVTVRVDLLPAGSVTGPAVPRLDDADHIGSLGCRFGDSVDGNLHAAFEDLLRRLGEEYRLAPDEAFVLLGSMAEVTVNQCVGGGWTATYVRVPRAALPGGRYWH
ncbi:acetamidase/formamidase family protein [Streptomyces sp.]|uniref:acetamidase/formamidase family protein n=1 Tax=Streptomyces sp. TaxID=1931 RepID=UPI002F42C1A9